MKVYNVEQFARRMILSAKRDRLALLTGAGISMVAPTQLPSGNALRDLAVESFTSVALREHYEFLQSSSSYTALLPELVFQRLWDQLGRALSDFFEVLRPASPNPVHHALAALSRDFDISVFTTNFDVLLEHAGTPHRSVIHLHGDLDNPESLIVRLNQVGRMLDPSLKAQFTHRTNRKHLYILGYSGRDEDVMDLIAGSAVSEVYWYLRDTNDLALRALERLSSRFAVSATFGDLMTFADRLNASLRGSPQTSGNRNLSKTRRKIATAWGESLPASSRYLGTASILVLANSFERANAVLESGLPEVRDNRVDFLVGAASVLRTIAKFQRGLELIDEALLAIDEEATPFLAASAASIKGLLLLENVTPDPINAATWFDRGIAVLEHQVRGKEEWEQLLARLYNNKGLALEYAGNPQPAIESHKRSRRIKKRIGDVVGLAQSAANLSIAYLSSGKRKTAAYWKREALKAVRQYQLTFLHVYLVRRWGTLLCEQGSVPQGLKMLLEGLRIAEGIAGDEFDCTLITTTISRYDPKGIS